MPLANAVPRNIPKMHPKFISMGEKYPSNKPTAIPLTNLSSQCILLSSIDIQLVQFTNLKNYIIMCVQPVLNIYKQKNRYWSGIDY